MNKYEELDKAMTKEIMPEFKGQVIDSVCAVCKGDGVISGKKCDNCEGKGHYKIEY